MDLNGAASSATDLDPARIQRDVSAHHLPLVPFTKAGVFPLDLLTSCSIPALWCALFLFPAPATNELLVPPPALASTGSWISSHLAAPCSSPAPWFTPAPAWPPTARPGALIPPADTFSIPALPPCPAFLLAAVWPLALALMAGTPSVLALSCLAAILLAAFWPLGAFPVLAHTQTYMALSICPTILFAAVRPLSSTLLAGAPTILTFPALSRAIL